MNVMRSAMFAALMIPLSSPDGWQVLKFSKIKPNTAVFSAAGLEVTVDHSSSPLIYQLKDAVPVKGFIAEIEIEGELNKAGDKFPEDAYLRLGLVAPGTRKMSFAEKLIAAAWVKKLFSLAPKGQGVDQIHFFNLAAESGGQSRPFPGSKGLMVENIVAVRGPDVKKLTFSHTLTAPVSTVALWLSIDGDDSKSRFKLKINKLELLRE